MKSLPCFLLILTVWIGQKGDVSGIRGPYKENELVTCGSHTAKDCKGCPGTHGKSYCNGDCFWNTQKSTVSCGQHSASNCAGCPQGHGSGYCHGDCKWSNNNCVAKADGVCTDGRECAKKKATSNSQKNRVLVNEINRIRKKTGYPEFTSDQYLANLATRGIAKCLNGHEGYKTTNGPSLCQSYCKKMGMDCHGEVWSRGSSWKTVQCGAPWKTSKAGHFKGAYQRGKEQNRGNKGVIGCGMSYCNTSYQSACIICTN